jgi:dUTP pyrophosphatase
MNLNKIFVKTIDPNSTIPIPFISTKGSAGFDLVISEIEHVSENKVIVKYGISSEFSSTYKVLIMPRSSFTHKSWVMQNSPAVIDSDFRGEWMSKFEAIPIGITTKLSGFKLKYSEFPYEVGDRITQAVLSKNIKPVFIPKATLSTTDRDNGGFGSTGK